MKKINAIILTAFCVAKSTLLFGGTVTVAEKNMALVRSLMGTKLVVAAHTAYASKQLDMILEMYHNFEDMIRREFEDIPETEIVAYMEFAADDYGSQLIEATSKFFDIIRKYKDLLAPIIEHGLTINSIDYKKSVLNDFLNNKNLEVCKSRMKTCEGFLAICNELRFLFAYIWDNAPGAFEAGEDYLEEAKSGKVDLEVTDDEEAVESLREVTN